MAGHKFEVECGCLVQPVGRAPVGEFPDRKGEVLLVMGGRLARRELPSPSLEYGFASGASEVIVPEW